MLENNQKRKKFLITKEEKKCNIQELWYMQISKI